MMSLKLQIISITFSFLYGVFFAGIILLFKNYLYHNNKYLKIIFNFIFCIINTMIYFFLLSKINEGILHYYLFIAIILGFFVFQYLKRIIEKHVKR